MHTETVTRADFLRSFGRIGLLSFGGPAAQISLMHEELVDRRGWLSEPQFLGALSFCMLLPGPEAMQLATYAGWRLRGTLGGLIAGLLFVLPGAAVILLLALAYASYGQLSLVQAAFLGIKAAVVIIVLRALWALSRKALQTTAHWMLAGLSFALMFFLAVPFPALIALAALWGYVTAQGAPEDNQAPSPTVPARKTLETVAIWAAIWAAPVGLAYAIDPYFLGAIALFFSKLAIVTFGGAYAVLTYMTQAVVETHGWLSTAQMIDALGLAETTPGPLILVTEFVGLLAGYAEGGVSLAVLAGALTLWVTFTPCFLWIFVGAPYVEWLLAQPRLNGALAAISAAVVGVILNLSVWFALHVLFDQVTRTSFSVVPVWTSFSTSAFGLVMLAASLMLILRLPMMLALAGMAAAGTILHVMV
ncbi:chromate efflux transporter [Pseudohalocynthiibacter aestuariivivens]|nr:chromate efflux transporter [Pseudohalocynthiibacter aestuariivivens]QIE47410.1 chromate efflux transporter [Pseudohalocynthiibacter aestuariivivens]